MKLPFVRLSLFTLIALLLTVPLLAACNLGTAQEARQLQLNATETGVPFDQVTLTNATLVPLQVTPGEIVLTPLGSPTAIGGAPAGVGVCNSLRVDVGDDPGNTLRLRQSPTNSAEIILLIPNNSTVQRVAGSGETSADGYTWVNIQYTDPNGIIATGWAAKNAMRDR